MNTLLLFESTTIAKEWEDERLPKPLKFIVVSFVGYRFMKSGKLSRITSIFRDYEEELKLGRTGVHAFYRAVDIGASEDSDQEIKDYTDYVNSTLSRGDSHPVCYSDPHGTGRHYHIQVGAAVKPQFK